MILEWRERTVLYKTLMDQHRVWIQRIHAELFHHGIALPEGQIPSPDTRASLAGMEVSPAARQRIAVGYHMIDATDTAMVPLKKQLEQFGRRQPACQALAHAHYGIGPLTSVFVWAELGDCQRFARSMQVVRYSGLDINVDSSDRHRAGGYLCRQGPATLRWAPYEAGKCASRPASPDYEYYQQVKKAHDGKLATIAMARKLARRCYHTLRNLNPDIVYNVPTA